MPLQLTNGGTAHAVRPNAWEQTFCHSNMHDRHTFFLDFGIPGPYLDLQRTRKRFSSRPVRVMDALKDSVSTPDSTLSNTCTAKMAENVSLMCLIGRDDVTWGTGRVDGRRYQPDGLTWC